MNTRKNLQEIKLSGITVEIFNCQNGKCANAKILLEPSYLNITIDPLDDVHLGDAFDVTCELKVLKALPSYKTKRP